MSGTSGDGVDASIIDSNGTILEVHAAGVHLNQAKNDNTVLLMAGGFGTRLDHESKFIAKPMVRIGKEPILYHLIENFYAQGFNDFVLCFAKWETQYVFSDFKR